MIERPTLIVMAKAPRVGVGKQRLARDIGKTEAWRVNRALHAATLRAACDRRWRTLLCVTPDRAFSEAIEVWPRRVARIAQGGGDLGARLARAMAGKRTVAVIGTDCPQIGAGLIAAAFAALRRAPFALGPARDGGFWLLAARSGDRAARAMAGVRWSTRHAANDVLANLGAAQVAILPTLRDIDTGADLRAAQRSARRLSSGV
ncbi:MAG: TIGR04282 family arsenosugar biosynthesis glycosyltransferase [Terricaulis sp.]